MNVPGRLRLLLCTLFALSLATLAPAPAWAEADPRTDPAAFIQEMAQQVNARRAAAGRTAFIRDLRLDRSADVSAY